MQESKNDRVYRVGIVSDTHGTPPSDIYEKFEGVDVILHAGDLGTSDVLLDLQVIAPVYAVAGNIDFFSFTPELPSERKVAIGPLTFALIHGHQFPRGNLEQSLLARYQKEAVDVIVYGHTHRFSIKKYGKIWVVNPGSSNCAYSPSGVMATFSSKEDLQFEMLHFCQNLEEGFYDDLDNDA